MWYYWPVKTIYILIFLIIIQLARTEEAGLYPIEFGNTGVSAVDNAVAYGEKRVLVLYDKTVENDWKGALFARQLSNLLSHFKISPAIHPVNEYQSGEMNNYDVTFYIGAIYASPIPLSFLHDFMNSTKTACWMGQNLWQSACKAETQEDNPDFINKFGFKFTGNAAGTGDIKYKGINLGYGGDHPGFANLKVVDATKAIVKSFFIINDIPYIINSNNRWFLADVSLESAGRTDRGLIFADLLHDILNIKHAEKHNTYIRVEDVNPLTPPEQLSKLLQVFYDEKIPFIISLIPEFHDYTGNITDGKRNIVKLTEKPELIAVLKNAQNNGGKIYLHGYTHQYDETANPVNGMTGVDYEFFRVRAEGDQWVLVSPVKEDSQEWITKRLDAAKEITDKAELTVSGWVTPHYMASPLDYTIIARRYRIAADGAITFVTGKKGIYFSQQFMPYQVSADQFGFTRLPESLGFISPGGEGGEGKILPKDLIIRSQKCSVVRDATVGGYIHWFIDVSYLRELVAGLKKESYNFIATESVEGIDK